MPFCREKMLNFGPKTESQDVSPPDGSRLVKIRPQAKIDNFAFKNSNIIIEGIIWKRKDYFQRKKFETQKNNFIIKFYFCPNSFLFASNQTFKKDAILINHGSFFQEKDFLHFDCFQFLKINSLMAETIKNNFPKQNI